MSDKIVNFYDKLGIKGATLPKTWDNHHMFNKSHTLCLRELVVAKVTV